MCGSVRQGSCYKHSLNDISRQTRKILKAVAANTQSASTFGFIGPAKYNPWVKVPDDVLYVGTTYTKHGDYRYDVPAISSRSLYKRDDLNYAAWGVSEQSLLKIDVKYRDHFLVNYVHGWVKIVKSKAKCLHNLTIARSSKLLTNIKLRNKRVYFLRHIKIRSLVTNLKCNMSVLTLNSGFRDLISFSEHKTFKLWLLYWTFV